VLSEKHEASGQSGRGVSALTDIQLDADAYGAAYDHVRVEFAAMSHIARREILDAWRDKHHTPKATTKADERTPLLGLPKPPTHESPAPPGWITHHGASSSSAATAFEESLTKSFTLCKPTFKPTDLSSIKLGHLGLHRRRRRPRLGVPGETDGAKPAAESTAVQAVDMTGFVGRGAAMGWREGEELDRRIRTRFAPFDDAWFASEHEAETPRDNVLAALRDLRPIASFTSRMPGFWRRAAWLALHLVLLALLAPVATALLLVGLVLELVLRLVVALVYGLVVLVKLLWKVVEVLAAAALFIAAGACVVGLVVGAVYVSLPLIVAGVVMFLVASLGGLPFPDLDTPQESSDRPWSRAQWVGGVVIACSPVAAIVATVYLFGWLCANAPDGRFVVGSGGCKRCLWLAVSFPFCIVNDGV
jgi:hypothetical protein